MPGQLIMPKQTRLDAVAELIAANNLLDGLKVHLYKLDVDPTDQNVLTDFTECDFDGYAASSTVVWGPDVFYNSLGQAVVFSDRKDFQSAHPQTKPQTVFGYYLSHPAVVGPPAVPEKLRLAFRFQAPVPINDAPDGCSVLVAFPFGQ